MARLQLTARELERGDLPRVCIRCGRPAELVMDKKFKWHPQWIDVLIVLGLMSVVLFLVPLILALVLNKSVRMSVPVCRRHRNHWAWRYIYIWGGLGVLVMLGVSAIVLGIVQDQLPYSLRGLPITLLLSTIGGFFFWLISAGLIQNSAIRAKEITDRDVTLVKVSPEFVKAFRRSRWDADEDEDDLPEVLPVRRKGDTTFREGGTAFRG